MKVASKIAAYPKVATIIKNGSHLAHVHSLVFLRMVFLSAKVRQAFIILRIIR